MKNQSDPNLHIKVNHNGHVVFISLYVDDIVIARNPCKFIDEVKKNMSQVFQMKDLGEMHYFLGLKLWRDVG